MPKLEVRKAARRRRPLKMAMVGPTGGGKTYTAIKVAYEMGAQNLILIDSERSSGEIYSDIFTNPDGSAYDHIDLPDNDPATYIDALSLARANGNDFVIVDGISGAWSGADGSVLEKVDRSQATGGKFGAWRDVTPLHNSLVQALIDCEVNLIVTMRVKMAYALETEGGKTEVKKLGLQPVQRDGMEYEFDVVADLDLDHKLSISKTRCAAIDGKLFPNGTGLAEPLVAWLVQATADPVPIERAVGWWQDPLRAAMTQENIQVADLWRVLGIEEGGKISTTVLDEWFRANPSVEPVSLIRTVVLGGNLDDEFDAAVGGSDDGETTEPEAGRDVNDAPDGASPDPSGADGAYLLVPDDSNRADDAREEAKAKDAADALAAADPEPAAEPETLTLDASTPSPLGDPGPEPPESMDNPEPPPAKRPKRPTPKARKS